MSTTRVAPRKPQTDFVDWSRLLVDLGACGDAVRWARTQPSLDVAWATCPRGDWMLWLAARLLPGDSAVPDRRSPARVQLVRAALECARLAWSHVREDHHAVVAACYETTQQWCEGAASIAQVRTAAAAAYAAYADAVSAAADAATYAAAYAAYATYAAAYAAYATYAASAAYAAADAAAAAAADADAASVGVATLARCADIVRQHYPTPPEWPR